MQGWNYTDVRALSNFESVRLCDSSDIGGKHKEANDVAEL